jgi:sugar-phosphatase
MATAMAEALLFDLDGTLVDTTVAVESAWRWAADQLDVPFSRIEPYIHGIPADQALGRAIPHLDEFSKKRLGTEILTRQADAASPVSPMPGALDLLAELPPERWAIVTSGDVMLARSSMKKAGLPEPAVLITADDINDGKPHPEPFILAMERLGVSAAGCIAVEDSPAGISSSVAAGVRVVGVGTTFADDLLGDATWLIPRLASLGCSRQDDQIVLRIAEPLIRQT